MGKKKCPCPCHKNQGIIHIVPCCIGGYVDDKKKGK
ncbi:hypothetical protein BpHYR1_010997 [Brachionus plicatilis]|uniref:Uncharacterized protein n=1 Tax=Brachionus plicatilis TaxID=10195 RepID=A0A3M7P2W5_BRAPC|nr:hypothetical protein BpHYR1_010997 [Brachionus plicatilis]